MRAWRSKLFIPESTLRAVDETMRDRRGVDTGSTLHPACDACSRRLGTRFAVEEYMLADRGITPGGDHYTDIRARCHGEEQVIRIEGMQWDMEGDAANVDPIRVAAIASIPFFVPGELELRIPANVFRSFMHRVETRRAFSRGMALL